MGRLVAHDLGGGDNPARRGPEGVIVDERVSSPTEGQTAPLPQVVRELWELIVAYFKQETVVPLKQLGRYIAFGLLGALLLGFGVVLLAIVGLARPPGGDGDDIHRELVVGAVRDPRRRPAPRRRGHLEGAGLRRDRRDRRDSR